MTFLTLWLLQLKYHETGRESNVNPGLGQWNMINKVNYLLFDCVVGDMCSMATYIVFRDL